VATTSLDLYTKLLRKAALVELRVRDAESSRTRALHALHTLSLDDHGPTTRPRRPTWPMLGDALSSLVEMAQWAGVDLEGVLRERALTMRDEIRASEIGKRVIPGDN